MGEIWTDGFSVKNEHSEVGSHKACLFVRHIIYSEKKVLVLARAVFESWIYWLLAV